MVKMRSWSSHPVAEDISAAPMAVKSAARALRIIEFFDEIRRPARANEIAERLGIPQSSTSVLLNSLVRLGYVDFDQSGKTYLPSIRMAVLATWRDTGCFRDGSMLNLLEHLAAETGLAGVLSMREGIFVRYLHVVQTADSDGLHIPLSVRRFAVNVASGIVVLAHRSDDEIKALMHRTRAMDPDKTSNINLKDVMARINFARAENYFLSAGLVDARHGGVAVALPASITGGWQDLAITISGAVDKIVAQEKDFVRMLMNGIHSIDPGSHDRSQSRRNARI